MTIVSLSERLKVLMVIRHIMWLRLRGESNVPLLRLRAREEIARVGRHLCIEVVIIILRRESSSQDGWRRLQPARVKGRNQDIQRVDVPVAVLEGEGLFRAADAPLLIVFILGRLERVAIGGGRVIAQECHCRVPDLFQRPGAHLAHVGFLEPDRLLAFLEVLHGSSSTQLTAVPLDRSWLIKDFLFMVVVFGG